MNSYSYLKLIIRDELIAFRDEFKEARVFLLIILVCFIGLFVYLDPFPDRKVDIAANYSGSTWNEFANILGKQLKERGISFSLVDTQGAVDNVLNIESGTKNANANTGFTYGVALSEQEAKGVYSLGSLWPEPVWIFYKKNKIGKIDTIKELSLYRVGIGPIKSGTYAISKKLFGIYGVDIEKNKNFQADGFLETEAKFLKGDIDALVVVSSYLDPTVQKLIRQPGVVLYSFKEIDAFVKNFNSFQALNLPAGAFDLIKHIPNQDVQLIATTTSLVVKKNMHPDLQLALLMSAKDLIHSSSRLFFAKRNEYPAYVDPTIPISPVAQRFYDYGPPHAMRYFPFWAAGFIDRAWLLILTLFAIIYPTSKISFHLRKFRFIKKERAHYERLLEIEQFLYSGKETLSLQQKEEILEELDLIISSAIKEGVPVGDESTHFAFLNAINLLRQKIGEK
jgi:TRAP-type uncharacterized transport system substrate-binding protein